MRSATVLIVDDDPALLDALSDMLRLRIDGLEVETSSAALDALDRISDRDYDAIVVDIKMPGMDGLELLGRIRVLRPDTPTLLITGHGEHELAVQALRGGAHDYVQKPIDRDYFVGSVNHAIEVHRLTCKVTQRTQTLEHEARELKECLEERARELRILYQREATARDEVDRANHDLREAQRRRQELVAMVAHDIGTPLTTLRGYVELLARQPLADGAVHQRAKSIILAETGRLERLVDELVDADDASNGFTVEPIDCDLVSIVRQQVELARARCQRHLIRLDGPECLVLRCDPDRMAQVFGNILTNALTHTGGGTVTVRVWLESDAVRATVMDEGRGIPVDRLEAIFEPHFRLAPAHDGSGPPGAGLGLGIARAIVEAHGGRLWASNSNRRCGATFELMVPRA
jgi:two-component system sensor histidine kinase/response regulator